MLMKFGNFLFGKEKRRFAKQKIICYMHAFLSRQRDESIHLLLCIWVGARFSLVKISFYATDLIYPKQLFSSAAWSQCHINISLIRSFPPIIFCSLALLACNFSSQQLFYSTFVHRRIQYLFNSLEQQYINLTVVGRWKVDEYF